MTLTDVLCLATLVVVIAWLVGGAVLELLVVGRPRRAFGPAEAMAWAGVRLGMAFALGLVAVSQGLQR